MTSKALQGSLPLSSLVLYTLPWLPGPCSTYPVPPCPLALGPSIYLGLGPEEGVADVADFLMQSPLLIHTLNAAV